METPPETPKYSVALELLQCAIELYLRGDSYYSALHLGGAAEEIFAVYLRELRKSSPGVNKPPSDHMKEAFLLFKQPASKAERDKAMGWIHNRMFGPKNSVKHMHGKKDAGVAFDPKSEAYDLIDLAISTYVQLLTHMPLPWLASVSDFDQAERSERLAPEA